MQENEKDTTFTRRTFLSGLGALTGSLIIGCEIGSKGVELKKLQSTAEIGSFLEVRPDGQVVFVIPSSEMGQGANTSLSQLIAEELEIGLEQIEIKFAPVGDAYKNPALQFQATGGSASIRGFWEIITRASAAAREALTEAAAKVWGLSTADCYAKEGMIYNKKNGKRLSYGELAGLAADVKLNPNPKIKQASDYKIIGKPAMRVDIKEKVTGAPVFGIDVELPGLLTAMVVHPPVHGAKIKSFDAKEALKMKGIIEVLQLPTGVAVIGEGYWEAWQASKKLKVNYDIPKEIQLSDSDYLKSFRKSLSEKGNRAASHGEIKGNESAKKYSQEFHVPWLAHATMSPQNFTADVRNDSVDLYGPTQAQGVCALVANKVTGISLKNINVHTTHLGGGFGRRFESDFVLEAVTCSHKLKRPVKVVWSREEDTMNDFFRPMSVSQFDITLDEKGYPKTWKNKLVCPSIMSRVFPGSVQGGIDNSSVEGAKELPYKIPHMALDYVIKDTNIPVGFWRSVGSSHNAFYIESVVDDLAKMAGIDPYEYRRELLKENPRFLRVLDEVAKMADWTKGSPLKDRFRGIAIHESFKSVVAQVAEISLNKDRDFVQVHRVWSVIDCGKHVNPDTVEAQIQGGIAFGLTAALKGKISFAKGRIEQENFDMYELLYLNEMPKVEVKILSSDNPIGGVGEPGVPPIAPAVTNAVFAATGKRLTHLPINGQKLS